jgi:hypothetical protein
MVISVIDTDTANTNVTVTAASSDTNHRDGGHHGDECVRHTNSADTLTFTPLTNALRQR